MAAFDEKDYTRSFDWSIWKRLTPFVRPFRRDFVGMLVFNGLCALVDVAIPLFQRYAIRNFIQADSLRGIVPFSLAYLLVILLQALSVVAFARNSMTIEMNMGRDMRRSLFHHLQTLSFSFYNVTPVGYLLTRVMSDTNRIASMIAWNMTDILWALFYVLGTFAAMLALNWRLALVVIVIVPVMAVLTGYFQNRILRWNRKVRKLNSRITGSFNEGITGAKTTKTLGTEEQTVAAFRDLTRQMHDAGIGAARLNAVYIPLVLFASTMAVAIVLLRGGYMVSDHLLELATLSTFTTYAVGIFEPIQMTAANIAEFISLQASIERVMDLMDKTPQIQDAPEVIEKYGDAFHPKRENWEPIRGEIEFRDVTFRYPDGGGNVLEHFSLHIPQGSTVAIVGETGAGKSTLVNLACRFFEPTEGQILIDGVDIRKIKIASLRKHFGQMLQDVFLFSGTIRSNILLREEGISDERIQEVCRYVNADHFINRLENGLDEEVRERGNNFSAGQRQLLSFARTIIHEPEVMILDEATANIDTETELLIQDSLEKMRNIGTMLIVAHRLSTIQHADNIIVLSKGKILEQGNHQELLAAHGSYYQLYTLQYHKDLLTK